MLPLASRVMPDGRRPGAHQIGWRHLAPYGATGDGRSARLLELRIATDRVALRQSRVDGIDLDVPVAQLAGQGSGQCDHGSLGCGVVPQTGRTVIHRARSDIDNLAAATGQHRRHHGLAGLQGATGVDRHDPIPFFDGQIHHPLVFQRGEQGCVVDQQSHRAPGGLHGRHHRGKLFGMGDVTSVRHALSAHGEDLGHCLRRIDDIGRSHPHTLAGERDAENPADTFGRPGHDGHLAA